MDKLDLIITPAALGALYGAPVSVAVDAALAGQVRRLLPDHVPVVATDPDGLVRLPGQAAGKAAHNGDRLSPPAGMPPGLVAVAVTPAARNVAHAWGAQGRLSAMHRQFAIYVEEATPGHSATLAAFLTRTMTEEATRLHRTLGTREADMAALRLESERLALGLAKARAMLGGVGFDTDLVVMETPVGDRTVGPAGDVDCTLVRENLPVDSAGMTGIALHVARPASGRGALAMRLIRAADGALLLSRRVPFHALAGGWHAVRGLPPLHGRGEVILDLAFDPVDATDTPPLLSLTDVRTPESGVGTGADGRPGLALRVLKGVTDPATAPVHAYLPTGALDLWHTEWSASAFLGDDWTFAGGPDHHAALKEDAGVDLVQMLDGGVVQTHPTLAAPVGLMAGHEVPGATARVRIAAEINHPQAAPVRFMALLVPETVDAVAARPLLTALADAPDSVPDGALAATTLVLAAGAVGDLHLVPARPLESPARLVIGVGAMGDSVAYGWCHWRGVVVEQAFDGTQIRLDPAPMRDMRPDPPRLIRAIRFPELMGRTRFLPGADRLEALTAEKGFRPLLVSEDAGYLQTHPLVEEVSAAFIDRVVPSGTLSVTLRASTAHEAAPDFRYAAILVREDMAEPETQAAEACRAVAHGLDDGLHVRADGRVLIRVCTLSALDEGHFRFERDALSPESDWGYHLAVTVAPVSDSVSFGWCRWTAIDLVGAGLDALPGDDGPQ
ncbi:DUF6212 domain-containing protein [Yunchengibacter salinarum]|uniref:DUF6212 domain-containing protein n=1 Tax=Yunchengibacter salinarum TaxID=3133399 RepID=UPI0035B66E99